MTHPNIRGSAPMREYVESVYKDQRVEWYPIRISSMEEMLVRFLRWSIGSHCHARPKILFKVWKKTGYPSGFSEDILQVRGEVCQICWKIMENIG